jgi:hypothetical protein
MQVTPLLDQIDGEIDQSTADSADDGKPTYQTILQHSTTARIVIPPRVTAVESVLPDRLVKGTTTLPQSYLRK